MADPRVHLFTNNATCRLGEDVSIGETSIQLETGKGDLFPDPSPGEIFVLTIEDLVQGLREIMFCTARSGDVVTVERGQEGTDDQAWTNSTNVIVQHRLTADTLEWLATGAEALASSVVVQLSCSNLTSDLAAGTNKGYFRAAQAFTLTAVRASVLVAGDYNPVTVDINKNGSTILSTKLTIDAGEKTSVTAATPAVISDDDIASDDEITIDIDGVPDGAKGLIVTLIGSPA